MDFDTGKRSSPKQKLNNIPDGPWKTIAMELLEKYYDQNNSNNGWDLMIKTKDHYKPELQKITQDK